jgi:methylmalonyl-CoA/ethylmalonyl-CoA epimerase
MTPADVPGFLFIDHVAIAVRPGELDAQVSAYKALGFEEVHREDVLGRDQVREVLLRIGSGPNFVQLIEPLSADSPVAKQIERNGNRGGLSHLAIRVADIHHAYRHLRDRGYRIVDEAPRPGSRGTTVFFVHPHATAGASLGYLLEVVQDNHDV